MSQLYISPKSERLVLYPADGLLNNASNEGYPVDDAGDVFESSVMDIF